MSPIPNHIHMKNNLLLFFLLLLTLKSAQAQSRLAFPELGVEVKPSDYKHVRYSELLEMTEPFPVAHMQMKQAQNVDIVGQVVGFAGGFLVGYSLGGYLFGNKEIDWQLLGPGLGLVAIDIPISLTARSKRHKALRSYINAMKGGRQRSIGSLRLQYQGNGVGLVLGL